MGRDPTNVMKVQISVRNVAEIINEFVSVMSLKAWVCGGLIPSVISTSVLTGWAMQGFIISTLLVSILANNVGFGRFREAAYTNQAKAEAAAAAAPRNRPATCRRCSRRRRTANRPTSGPHRPHAAAHPEGHVWRRRHRHGRLPRVGSRYAAGGAAADADNAEEPEQGRWGQRA